ncbi:hypothetical protein L1987_39672 [Smallanthus sonchifolius]|uniref:Uncharacterized protein n=1 Tax=Smallanthus sonchifolius TaxID=185202 RepID=A0ACB9HPE7_9ASTR|nr:hypothetical protein L1987_39672 [Smallanthus sonchifolius]
MTEAYPPERINRQTTVGMGIARGRGVDCIWSLDTGHRQSVEKRYVETTSQIAVAVTFSSPQHHTIFQSARSFSSRSG